MFLRKILLAALMGVLLAAQGLRAQVVDIGLSGGYSLSNEAVRLKGATAVISLGPSHGFYVGPQFDFNLGKGFSIRTGLDFHKGGSKLFVDAEKLVVNLHQVSEDIKFGDRQLIEYFEANPDLEIGSFTAQQVLDGVAEYDSYMDKALALTKGTDLTLKVDRYSLGMPILLRYTSGRFSVSAGVHLNVMLFPVIDAKANLPGGIVYSDKDLEKILPYVHLALAQAAPTSEDPRMRVERFYRSDVAHAFSVALQCGLDYNISDWIALQINYQYGVSSNIKHPWTNLMTIGDRFLQAGLVYYFPLKKKG